MKVKLAVLGSPSVIVVMVSVNVKQYLTKNVCFRAQELCESGGVCPGFSIPSLIVLIIMMLLLLWCPYCYDVLIIMMSILFMVSVDVKQHWTELSKSGFSTEGTCPNAGHRMGNMAITGWLMNTRREEDA